LSLEPLPDGGVRALAPAKVNLYLEVLGLRPDGYHEIDTVMQALSLHDDIEFRPVPVSGLRGPGDVRLETIDGAGNPLPLLAGGENLVVKASRVFFETYGPGRLGRVALDIRLVKRIPMGAGLGGGSSDAAWTLAALGRLTGTEPSRSELAALAGRLGSDVPFFLEGGTTRCRGRGEILLPLGDVFGEEGFHCVLVYPGFQVPTSLIYRELDRLSGSPVALTTHPPIATMTLDSIQKALRGRELFFNRLEPVACQAFPELESIKKEIQKEPFLATLMSGSGSTMYGVTRSHREAEERAARLRARIRGEVIAAWGLRPSV
jgi:4-diphosphocytidyl-2-C-methyl-D-erythritol kinase